jgi:uncharacterized protein (TIGR00730 family)
MSQINGLINDKRTELSMKLCVPSYKLLIRRRKFSKRVILDNVKEIDNGLLKKLMAGETVRPKDYLGKGSPLQHLDERPTVCVFCGSRPGNPGPGVKKDIYMEAAYRLGELIGAEGWRLVFGGGGKEGLMKAVADGALKHKGEVIGVTPMEFLLSDGRAGNEGLHPGATATIVVRYMAERVFIMSALSDAKVAAPGGPGTLAETIDAITLRQTRFMTKPTIMMNINHYWDKLFAVFDEAARQEFMSHKVQDLVYNADTPEKTIELLGRLLKLTIHVEASQKAKTADPYVTRDNVEEILSLTDLGMPLKI